MKRLEFLNAVRFEYPKVTRIYLTTPKTTLVVSLPNDTCVMVPVATKVPWTRANLRAVRVALKEREGK